jgi:tricarballylate dehydrogenase
MTPRHPRDAAAHDETDHDVIVVGGGNAAFCAAHAARERGARVLVLEKAAPEEAGGNSYYTAGAFRLAHQGLGDLTALLDDREDPRLADTVLPEYTESEFSADLERITSGRNDPEMTRVLVSDSRDTIGWLTEKGLRWELLYERQTYVAEGKWVFFGGLHLGSVGGGKGLMAQHTEAARTTGIEVRHSTEVVDLLTDSAGRITGVHARDAAGERRLQASAVVLAAGGFEASSSYRQKYLGPEWSRAIVRGTPLNTGEVLHRALDKGAAPFGDWASCHSVQWDAGAPVNGGERELTNQLTRQSYPMGIVVNRDGHRFIDEGADYRNYTYAKYGREVLKQPGGVAFQLFDAKTRHLLRPYEYDSAPITGAEADTLEDLAKALGIDPEGLRRTVEEFNTAITGPEFDPSVKDGRRVDLDPPKSNWASALDTPPFYGFSVACGITFTFGGVTIAPETGEVLGRDGAAIPGLYAAGELVGGLFSGNYPGGSGLIAGSVFGRRAGRSAAGSRQG